jgi:hypothetical protein
MYSPVILATSTLLANCSASRLVVKPRLSVCRFSGVRYRTLQRVAPLAVWYLLIVAIRERFLEFGLQLARNLAFALGVGIRARPLQVHHTELTDQPPSV